MSDMKLYRLYDPVVIVKPDYRITARCIAKLAGLCRGLYICPVHASVMVWHGLGL